MRGAHSRFRRFAASPCLRSGNLDNFLQQTVCYKRRLGHVVIYDERCNLLDYIAGLGEQDSRLFSLQAYLMSSTHRVLTG